MQSLIANITYRGLRTSECLPTPMMRCQPCDPTIVFVVYLGNANDRVVRHDVEDHDSNSGASNLLLLMFIWEEVGSGVRGGRSWVMKRVDALAGL